MVTALGTPDTTVDGFQPGRHNQGNQPFVGGKNVVAAQGRVTNDRCHRDQGDHAGNHADNQPNDDRGQRRRPAMAHPADQGGHQ